MNDTIKLIAIIIIGLAITLTGGHMALKQMEQNPPLHLYEIDHLEAVIAGNAVCDHSHIEKLREIRKENRGCK